MFKVFVFLYISVYLLNIQDIKNFSNLMQRCWRQLARTGMCYIQLPMYIITNGWQVPTFVSIPYFRLSIESIQFRKGYFNNLIFISINFR